MENRTESVLLHDPELPLPWYGSDHLACYALIDPPQPLLYSDEHLPLMSSEGVTEVLEEVAPVAMRGKQINAFLHVSGCNEARMTEYEERFDNEVNAYL